MKKQEFTIKPLEDGSEPFIELNKLLKALQIAESGAMAGLWISDGMVKVNGKTETRKRAKLRNGDVVTVLNQTITIKG